MLLLFQKTTLGHWWHCSYFTCEDSLHVVQSVARAFSKVTQLVSGRWDCKSKSGLSSVQSLSRVQLFVTPWTAAHQASLSITNSQSLLTLMSIQLVRPSNHFILCCPLFLQPTTFPRIRVFSSESVLHIRWLKYWSFSLSISPSNEYSGLISFRIDQLALLAVQETLKLLLQHYSSRASALQCSAFFIVQLSHPYMTIGKTIASTRLLLCW